MSADEKKICAYNQNGFCKFRNKCFNKHLDLTCDLIECTDSLCRSNKRHPRECKKFLENRTCHFNERCAFKHSGSTHENNQHELIKVLCGMSVNQQNEIIHMKEEITTLKSIIEQIDIENSIKVLKQEISLLHTENKNLEQRISDIEEESEDESEDETDLDNVQEKLTCKFKCEMCDFQSQKEITLAKHINTKHAVSTKLGPETYEYNWNVIENIEPAVDKFPCEKCDKLFKDFHIRQIHFKEVHCMKGPNCAFGFCNCFL